MTASPAGTGPPNLPVPKAMQSLLVLPVCSQSCPFCAPSPAAQQPGFHQPISPSAPSLFLGSPSSDPQHCPALLLHLPRSCPRSTSGPQLSTPPTSSFCTLLPTPTPDPSVLHLQHHPSTCSSTPALPVSSQHPQWHTFSSIPVPPVQHPQSHPSIPTPALTVLSQYSHPSPPSSIPVFPSQHLHSHPSASTTGPPFPAQHSHPSTSILIPVLPF